MRVFRVLLIASLLGLSVTGNIPADEAELEPFRDMLERAGFPENDETRRILSDSIDAPAYPAVESPFEIVRQISDKRLVQFELRKGIREWYLIFRNQRGEEPRESYPLWGRGTWIIKKDLLTGEFLQAKIFLQDNEESFVRIFPNGSQRSRLDVHLYGRQLGDDVIIPVPFETLMLSPFARIAFLTDRSIDWGLVFPNPDQPGYRRVESFIADLRPYKDRIVEIHDAAIDGGGRNVYIETGKPIPPGIVPEGKTGLNCSGYVKWVVDGIYSAWSGDPGGRYLDIDPLREPTNRTNRNPWSESRSATDDDARNALDVLLRDPHFGLDWNRNLAYNVESVRLKRDLSQDEKQVLDTGDLPGIAYRRDMGYPLEDLVPVLYQLAAGRPGAIYLAAVNSRFVPNPSQEDPEPLPLHQYWHVSVLAPWFENGDRGSDPGSFHVAVLDSGDVSESLIKTAGSVYEPRFTQVILDNATRYARLGLDGNNEILVPEVMVHLVRIDLPPDFQASPLPEAY